MSGNQYVDWLGFLGGVAGLVDAVAQGEGGWVAVVLIFLLS